MFSYQIDRVVGVYEGRCEGTGAGLPAQTPGLRPGSGPGRPAPSLCPSLILGVLGLRVVLRGGGVIVLQSGVVLHSNTICSVRS